MVQSIYQKSHDSLSRVMRLNAAAQRLKSVFVSESVSSFPLWLQRQVELFSWIFHQQGGLKTCATNQQAEGFYSCVLPTFIKLCQQGGWSPFYVFDLCIATSFLVHIHNGCGTRGGWIKEENLGWDYFFTHVPVSVLHRSSVWIAHRCIAASLSQRC